MTGKQTVIRCVTEVLCAIAVCITGVWGTNRICDASKGSAASVLSSRDEPFTFADGIGQSEHIVYDGEETTVDETDTSRIIENDRETQSQSDAETPATVAEILRCYNAATQKNVSKKAGLQKVRFADNEKIEDSKLAEQFAFLFYKFMGIGEENKFTTTVEKGNWGQYPPLLASRLTESDINDAACVKSGENYCITLRLKNGSGSASKSNPVTQPNTPLDKCGISVGTEDKAEYDHKSATVTYDAVKSKFANAKVSEAYSDAVVKATIRSSDGQLVSLKADWNTNAKLENILGQSPIISCTAHVVYSDFKY